MHPEWAVHGPGFPTFERLMEALEAVVAAHPRTTFVGAHVCCCAEDLAWVARMLDAVPEPVHGLLAAHRRARAASRARRGGCSPSTPTGSLFGTDELPPRREAYETYFRFLETADEHFSYSPDPDDPWPQGRWHISALDLPADALAAIYRDERAARARRLTDAR